MEDYLIDGLVLRAKEASKNAFVPSTNIPVGAAIAGEKGVYIGASVECASQVSGCCAERIALYNGITAGDTSFFALAVYHDADTLPYPCGTCLQALSEFSDDMEIAIVGRNDIKIIELKKLLPNPMGWDRLED